MAMVIKQPIANASIMTVRSSESQRSSFCGLKVLESHGMLFLGINVHRNRPITTRNKTRAPKLGNRNAMTQMRIAHGRILRPVCSMLLKLGRFAKENCASSIVVCRFAAEA